MIDVMDWDECKKKFIREVEVDKERIMAIMDKASKRLKRAQETEVDKDNISFVVEDYYEVIKEILIAYLLRNGLRSKNHQCLFSYFYKKNPNYEKEIHLILQMSFFRNRLNYYGEDIPLEFYQKNKEEFERIIESLKNLIGKD